MQSSHACWHICSYGFINFFLLTMVLMLDTFTLKWWATTAADLCLWYTVSSLTFSCNVMTFLCFLEVLPASLVVLCMGPLVLFRVYAFALSVMKNTQEPQEITSLLKFTIYWRDKLLTWTWLASHGLLSRYSQHLSSLQNQQEILQNYYSISVHYSQFYAVMI